jgi:hypothetical protein
MVDGRENTVGSARSRLRANLVDAKVANRRATILAIIGSLELVDIDAVFRNQQVTRSSRVAGSNAINHLPGS